MYSKAFVGLCQGLVFLLAADHGRGAGLVGKGPKELKPGVLAPIPGSYAVGRSGVWTVTASAGRGLMHTEQHLAFDGDPVKLAEADALAQARAVVRELDGELRRFGCDLRQCLRLNVCLKHTRDRVVIEHVLTEHLKENLPARTYVVGDLPLEEALVGIDAVACSTIAVNAAWSPRVSVVSPRQGIHGSRHAVLPSGRPIFVSGQAVRGEGMAASARRTMEQLGVTLKFLNRGWTNVVRVKTFLREPVKNVRAVREVIAEFFPDKRRIPPQVYVEWTARNDLEIELVVDGGPPVADAPLVEYLTPPDMKASPVFCRVVRVNGGRLVYSSGITGPAGSGAEGQVQSIFGDLETTMAVFGVDMRHLVKATYYVSDGDTSKALNEVRPTIYDPGRPPAASKAMVRGAGFPGVGAVVDMIGVAPTKP